MTANDRSRQPPGRPILLLGIGNILLRDEGVGVRVIEEIQKLPLPPQVEVLDGGTLGIDLVDDIAGREKVIVVDAVQAEGEPGSIYRFESHDLLPSEGMTISLHQMGLQETLAMARQMKCAPRQVVVFGIKPKSLELGLELSEEVSAAAKKVVALILQELAQ